MYVLWNSNNESMCLDDVVKWVAVATSKADCPEDVNKLRSKLMEKHKFGRHAIMEKR